jgi:hypothetical protein
LWPTVVHAEQHKLVLNGVMDIKNSLFGRDDF